VPLQAIVFDFDGVIANSEPLHYEAFRAVLAERDVELSAADYYARYLGYDDRGVFAAMSSDRGIRWSPDDLSAFVDRKAVLMEELERDRSVLFPGADAAVRRAAGWVPLAIASGALGPEIRRILDRARLTPLFAAIVSAEDTPASKPSPDPYLRALELLSAQTGTPIPAPSCVAVEDSRWGLASARAAGLRTVGITHTYPAAELTGADLVIESLDHLELGTLERLCAEAV
jgi:beta-phosphoglucomutase-like phosphatase (HAD superfamily)